MDNAHAPHQGTQAAIGARLDRLPESRRVWELVALLSLGGFFETYDLGLTATLPPGLIQAGIFSDSAKGVLGLGDQAAFAVATFAGLFLGTAGLGRIADRFGRRAIFSVSLLWYAAGTVMMAVQNDALSVDLWRFITGIGIGLELVTIDSFIAELVPASSRGKAFAINQCLQLTAVPLAALLSWLVMPHTPMGMAGWRWVAMVPAFGALFVWWIRRKVPESPRWLAARGRFDEANAVVSDIETRIEADRGQSLPPWHAASTAPAKAASLREIFQGPLRKSTVMLITLNIFHVIGFYGFNSWLPTLLASRGVSFVNSLAYTTLIAVMFPLTPLIFMGIADKIERKWLIVGASLAMAVLGLAFSRQTSPIALILLGTLITTASILLSFSYHAYQAELYPTQIRTRAVGFVYSFGRLAIVFGSVAISALLKSHGAPSVFIFIAGSMVVVALAVGILGPKTKGKSLNETDAV